MQNWQWSETGGIKFITIPGWKQQGVDMLFASRHKGAGRYHFDSLNMALHVGDDKETVLLNRQKLMDIWGKSSDDLICCEQVHGNRIANVDNTERGRGARKFDTVLPGCDGLITATSGLYLALFFADCLPIFLFDPLKRIIAVVHSGWKGTMGKIAIEAVKGMQQQYQVDPGSIQAFIGPGIGPCCFEISRDLADQVGGEFHERQDVLQEQNGSVFWDLARSNYYLLQKAGLKSDNIIVCELCTRCRQDLFFSYRGAGGLTGRMAAVIGLR